MTEAEAKSRAERIITLGILPGVNPELKIDLNEYLINETAKEFLQIVREESWKKEEIEEMLSFLLASNWTDEWKQGKKLAIEWLEKNGVAK